MTLDQRSIAIFLHLEGKNDKQIHEEKFLVLNENCVGYSTVTRFIREFKISNKAAPIKNEPKIMEWDNDDYLIKNTVDEEPFLSIRQIAKKTGIPKSTIYIQLTNYLGYISKHLKCVPHLLSELQKQNRVTIAIDLLRILEKAQRQGWRYFVTGDESWFDLCYCSTNKTSFNLTTF